MVSIYLLLILLSVFMYLFIHWFIFMKVISQKVWEPCKTPSLLIFIAVISSWTFMVRFVIMKIKNVSIFGKSLWMRSFSSTCFKDVYKKVECSFKFRAAAADWQLSLLGWSLFIVCKKSTTCLVSNFHTGCWRALQSWRSTEFHHSQGSTCPILIYFKL